MSCHETVPDQLFNLYPLFQRQHSLIPFPTLRFDVVLITTCHTFHFAYFIVIVYYMCFPPECKLHEGRSLCLLPTPVWNGASYIKNFLAVLERVLWTGVYSWPGYSALCPSFLRMELSHSQVCGLPSLPLTWLCLSLFLRCILSFLK